MKHAIYIIIATIVIICANADQSYADMPALSPAQAHRSLQGVTPEKLVAEFVAEVSAIAKTFPELGGFPEYARTRSVPLELVYSRGLRPIRTKRGIRPSDFDSKGIHLQFMLRGDDNPVAAQSHQITDLPNLHLTLFVDLALAEDTSDGLEKKLCTIIETYKALLIKLNKETANKGIDSTDEWQTKLQSVIRQFDTKAVVLIENGTYTYRHNTQTFKVHAIGKTGEISAQAHDEEGPNFDGIMLEIALQDGPYQGAAVMPQDLPSPYWTTFINAYPVSGGKYLWLSLSYGVRADKNLMEAVKTCFGPVLIPDPGAVNHTMEKARQDSAGPRR